MYVQRTPPESRGGTACARSTTAGRRYRTKFVGAGFFLRCDADVTVVALRGVAVVPSEYRQLL